MNIEEATVKILENKLVEFEDKYKIQPVPNINNLRRVLDCIDKAIEDLEPIWEMQSGNYYGDKTLSFGEIFDECSERATDGLWDMKGQIEHQLSQQERKK